jgi:hypothetical protein
MAPRDQYNPEVMSSLNPRLQPIYQSAEEYYDTRGTELQRAIDEVARRREEARQAMYAEPHRTMGQALAEAIASAIPALVGGAVGGKAALGAGLSAGGAAGQSLSDEYQKRALEDRATSRADYNNLLSLGLSYDREKAALGEKRSELGTRLGVESLNEENRAADRDLKNRELNLRQDALDIRKLAALNKQPPETMVQYTSKDGQKGFVPLSTVYKRETEANQKMGEKPAPEKMELYYLNDYIDVGDSPVLTKEARTKAGERIAADQKMQFMLDKAETLTKELGSGTLVGKVQKAKAQELRETQLEMLGVLKEQRNPIAMGNITEQERKFAFSAFPLPTEFEDDPSSILKQTDDILEAINRGRSASRKMTATDLQTNYKYKYVPEGLTPEQIIKRNARGEDFLSRMYGRDMRSEVTKQFLNASPPAAANGTPKQATASGGWSAEKEKELQELERKALGGNRE